MSKKKKQKKQKTKKTTTTTKTTTKKKTGSKVSPELEVLSFWPRKAVVVLLFPPPGRWTVEDQHQQNKLLFSTLKQTEPQCRHAGNAAAHLAWPSPSYDVFKDCMALSVP